MGGESLQFETVLRLVVTGACGRNRCGETNREGALAGASTGMLGIRYMYTRPTNLRYMYDFGIRRSFGVHVTCAHLETIPAPTTMQSLLERLLLLGLALPQVRAFRQGTSAAHPPCGGPPPSSRRIATARLALAGDHTIETKASPTGGQPSLALASILHAGLVRAVDDRRRIDELVTYFDYNGVLAMPAEGQHVEGQGAVKRLLTALLMDNEVQSVDLDGDAASVVLTLHDSADQPRALRLRPSSQAGGALSSKIGEVLVHEETDAPPTDAAEAPALLFGGGVASKPSAGPKWETFDGRVRQRIWQTDDIFAAGNEVLKTTLEITTGRLIVAVDQTVWDLYGEKMRDWAASVDLVLDPIIAKANEVSGRSASVSGGCRGARGFRCRVSVCGSACGSAS